MRILKVGMREFYHHASRYFRMFRAGELDRLVLLYHGVPVAQADKVKPKRRRVKCRLMGRATC